MSERELAADRPSMEARKIAAKIVETHALTGGRVAIAFAIDAAEERGRAKALREALVIAQRYPLSSEAQMICEAIRALGEK